MEWIKTLSNITKEYNLFQKILFVILLIGVIILIFWLVGWISVEILTIVGLTSMKLTFWKYVYLGLLITVVKSIISSNSKE